MSTEPVGSSGARSLTLADYVAALIDAVAVQQPGALARMRQAVGARRAIIELDDEAVGVAFGPDRLRVEPVRRETVADGEGATNSGTVLDLLDGTVEVAGAILDGRLRVRGKPEDVVRMFTAIEILLDASARTPALQALAARFRLDHPRRRDVPADTRGGAWYPFPCTAQEIRLLRGLGLLPAPQKSARRRRRG